MSSAESAAANTGIAESFAGIRAEKGCLYVVSTPIGNLEEISYRALAILGSSDVIYCEDTRRTGILMKSYGISAKLISYYSVVESKKTDRVIETIKQGLTCSLVSDAGTPCISDPGSMLIRRCIDEGIGVKTIPGSSSVIHALVVSGFETGDFHFRGFLPQKKGRTGAIKELAEIRSLIVIMESPYRIRKTLRELLEHLGNKDASVSREMSKKFEQTLRGPLKDLSVMQFPEKGEFVLIINNR
ncbi:MAG: 16S rRNA (cytidine(1402)-2'-O)-methyltransferase [Ignavibacteria bacterium]|nr:16S rRNA (cytidine(1402)-2'-O)-methyltransferase [Ignavibacteria bacterium]